MRQKLVMGNWKMHGSLTANADLLTQLHDLLPEDLNAKVVVCPPLPYLAQAFVELDAMHANILLGAQNVCAEEIMAGAFTGEVSAAMLDDFAVQYCLVGHSERREYYGEDDKAVAQKFNLLQKAGITPVLCIGENLKQRENGDTLAVIESQLLAVLNSLGVNAFADAVVAYEPVWAIGTGKTATAEQAQEVHAFIRQLIAKSNVEISESLQILYGGSVKADNAEELFAMADIDGALVGGASLKAEDFSEICKAAN
jgi:triosephosphate isomerase